MKLEIYKCHKCPTLFPVAVGISASCPYCNGKDIEHLETLQVKTKSEHPHVDSNVIIKESVDEIYSAYIGKQGKIFAENDDNSFTVTVGNEDIVVFEHEFTIIKNI